MIDDEEGERIWTSGHRAAWQSLLQQATRELMADGAAKTDPEIRAAALLAEREATLATLRRVCAEHGDNDWPDNLHLADVVEKHLARHLDSDADT